MQRFRHLALHFGKALLHHLQHGGLADGLRFGHMVQPARQPFLPVAKVLQAGGEPGHLTQQRFGGGGGAGGGAEDEYQEGEKHEGGPAEEQNLGGVPGVALAEKRDHRRPNRRSMSWRLSST